MRIADLTGKRIGSVVVLAFSRSLNGRAYWLVQCDCGKRLIMRVRTITRTCGCVRGGVSTHGETNSPEFRAWVEMRRRCRSTSRPGAKYYALRAVLVCRRWLSFDNFLSDMGRKPSPQHSLDREDVNGNYEPGNCRWATPAQQIANRRPFVRRGRFSKPKEEAHHV